MIDFITCSACYYFENVHEGGRNPKTCSQLGEMETSLPCGQFRTRDHIPRLKLYDEKVVASMTNKLVEAQVRDLENKLSVHKAIEDFSLQTQASSEVEKQKSTDTLRFSNAAADLAHLRDILDVMLPDLGPDVKNLILRNQASKLFPSGETLESHVGSLLHSSLGSPPDLAGSTSDRSER